MLIGRPRAVPRAAVADERWLTVFAGSRVGSSFSRRPEFAAAFLTRLVDRYERERRLAAVGRAYQETPDDDYTTLTQEWDALSGEDIDGA